MLVKYRWILPPSLGGPTACPIRAHPAPIPTRDNVASRSSSPAPLEVEVASSYESLTRSPTPNIVLKGEDSSGSIFSFVEQSIEGPAKSAVERIQEETPSTSHLPQPRRSRRLARKTPIYDKEYDSYEELESEFPSEPTLRRPPRRGRARRPGRSRARRAISPPSPHSPQSKSARTPEPQTRKPLPAAEKRRENFILDLEEARRLHAELSRLKGNFERYTIRGPTAIGPSSNCTFRCSHEYPDGELCTEISERLADGRRHALTHYPHVRLLCGNPGCDRLFAREDSVKRHLAESCRVKKRTNPKTSYTTVVVDDVRSEGGVTCVVSAHPITLHYD